jgi:hypothetical protein
MKVLSQVLSSALFSRSASVISGCARGPASGVGGSGVEVGGTSVAVVSAVEVGWASVAVGSAVGAVVFVGMGVMVGGGGVAVGGTGVDTDPQPLKKHINRIASTMEAMVLFMIKSHTVARWSSGRYGKLI